MNYRLIAWASLGLWVVTIIVVAVLYVRGSTVPATDGRLAIPLAPAERDLVLGFINTLVRPVLAILTLPITVLTLGIFYLVLNGLLFWLASALLPGFQVQGFVSAMVGAILYGVIAWALSALIPNKKG